MLKNSLCQPSLSFSFNAAPLFLFLFPGQPPLFFLLFSSSTPFLFFWCVALYFSAQNTFFSAQTFFSLKTFFSAQNVFASAQNFFQFSHSSISALLFSAPPPFSVSFQLLSLRSNVLFSCFTSFLFE